MKRFLGTKRRNDSLPDDAGEIYKTRKVGLSSVIDLAVELWRIQDRVKRLQAATGQNDPSIAFSVDKIQHILKEIGIEACGYTGQIYNEGMSLDVLAFDYPVKENPPNRIIQETVSPAIFFDGRLHKMAQVIVGKACETPNDAKHD